MVSSYMPDVEVHIAFDSGFTTPAASRTWTDVSTYVELAEEINIDFGRQDERSTADANSLTLTLDNTDGRFTAGRAASPYYPNVKIGRPIRVRVTPPGGSVVTRFVGFIDEWPVEWEGTDSYAKATVRASSRLSRLGLTAKLRSVIEHEIESTSPARYWTLGDVAGSVIAVESSGGPPLEVSSDINPLPVPVFGNATGPGSDGLTAAEFFYTAAGGGILRGGSGFTTAARTMRCWVRVTALPVGFDATIMSVGNGHRLRITPAGVLAGTSTTGPNINDGAGHDLALTHDGTTERLYVDGVEVASAAGAAPSLSAVYVGGFSGSMAHVGIYDTALAAGTLASQASATLTGFTGDRTDVRALRLLAWAGVAATEVTTQTGVETMTYQQTSGQSVVDALRECESTESGVLYDRPDGNVGFHNRAHRYQKTASATLDMSAQHVGADYSPKLDRSTLVNDATVSNPTTGESARSVDTTSSDEYGVATGTGTSVADSYDPLQQKAAWLVASYAEPRNRVPSLTVDVLAHQGLTPSAQTLLGITVGDLLAVSNAPTQSDTTSPSYFVEGYTETIGPESYEITFNLSPTYPTLNTVIFDHATRAEFDAGFVFAL